VYVLLVLGAAENTYDVNVDLTIVVCVLLISCFLGFLQFCHTFIIILFISCIKFNFVV